MNVNNLKQYFIVNSNARLNDDYDTYKASLRPIKWKDENNLYTYDEITGQSNDIGMRMDNLVAIDFDDPVRKEEIKKYLLANQDIKCWVNETKKGFHVIFKKPEDMVKKATQGTKFISLGGIFPVDTRIDDKGIIYRKVQGVDRQAAWWPNNELDFSDLQEFSPFIDTIDLTRRENIETNLLPFYITNAHKHNGQPLVDTWTGFDDITGGNAHFQPYANSFMGLITSLKQLGWENKEIADLMYNTISGMNKMLPMSRVKPLDVIDNLLEKFVEESKLRKEYKRPTSMDVWLDAEGKMKPKDEIVDNIIDTMVVKKFDGVLYYFENGEWTKDSEFDNNYNLKTYIWEREPRLSSAQVKELYIQLSNKAPQGTLAHDWKYKIYTPTQIINVKTKEIKENDGSEFYVNKMNLNYNKDAKSNFIDTLLDEYSNKNGMDADKDVVEDILFALSNTLVPNASRKMFVWYGDGSNGKGTLFKMIQSMIDRESYSLLGIDTLEKDTYSQTLILNKLGNFGEEIPDKFYLEDSSFLKSITSSDKVQLRGMHSQGVAAEPYVTLHFSSNVMLKSKEKQDPLVDRLVFIPMRFNAKMKKQVPVGVDPRRVMDTQQTNWHDEITSKENLEYLFKILVDKLFKIHSDKEQHILSLASINVLDVFINNNDPVRAWIVGKGKEYFVGRPSKTVYEACSVTIGEERKMISSTAFTKEVKEIYPTLDNKQNSVKLTSTNTSFENAWGTVMKVNEYYGKEGSWVRGWQNKEVGQ